MDLSTRLDAIALALRTHYGRDVEVDDDDTITGRIIVWSLNGGLLAEVSVSIDGSPIGVDLLDGASMTDVAGRALAVTVHDEPTTIADTIADAIGRLLDGIPRVPCTSCSDGSCVLCDDHGMVPALPTA